jgi:hypothetical protein
MRIFTHRTLILAAVAAVTISASVLYAQMGMGRRGRAPIYNPSTETTVKGTVEEVRNVTGRRGWGGTHLTLKTGDKSMDVHVGPAWFISKNKFTFAKGDEVEVIGSKVAYQGADALVAREIKKGDKTLTLRNADGFPVWSRRGGAAPAPATPSPQ